MLLIFLHCPQDSKASNLFGCCFVMFCSDSGFFYEPLRTWMDHQRKTSPEPYPHVCRYPIGYWSWKETGPWQGYFERLARKDLRWVQQNDHGEETPSWRSSKELAVQLVFWHHLGIDNSYIILSLKFWSIVSFLFYCQICQATHCKLTQGWGATRRWSIWSTATTTRILTSSQAGVDCCLLP